MENNNRRSDLDSGVSKNTKSKKTTGFAGDVLKLVSGTTFAQALGILAAPILSRLFAPEAFGVAALFSSVVAVIAVFATMRYERAIMLPADDADAANLVGVSLGITLVVSLLTVLLIRWVQYPLLRILNAPDLAPYLPLTALGVFFAGSIITFNYWLSRLKRFGRMSVVKVSNSVITTSTTITLGSVGYNSGGAMISSRLVGQAVATGVLGWYVWRNDWNLFRRAVSRKSMLANIRRYRKFPLYTTWATLLNTASWQLPAFLLSAYFSTEVVGFYSLGFRIVQLPMSLIGRSISQVFFQRASEANNKGSLTALVDSTFRKLTLFGLFPMLLLSFIGADLFSVFFGERWREAGVYLQILSPWAFVWFISSPLSILSSVLEKQEFGLIINGLIFVTRLISLVIGGMMGNVRLALTLFSVSGILVYGYLVIWLMNLVGIHWRHIFKVLLPQLLLIIPVGATMVYLQFVNANPLLVLGSAVLFGFFYVVGLVVFVPEIQDVIRLMLR
ncbi:MAG: oligosaccharide flippase family protein [Gammaproteobacteria bacterium]|nr:oligosaccharide flippase family protein [Gammaproteobacteria bacterium]